MVEDEGRVRVNNAELYYEVGGEGQPLVLLHDGLPRRMIEQGSGVILALDSGSANGSPMMGGTGPADAATDTFVRNLAAEVGPHGVRVLGIWTAGVPETLSKEKLAAVDSNLEGEADFQGVLDRLDQMRMLRRSPRLAEVADVAAFLASDRAAAITGTFVNVTGGMLPS